MAIFSSQGAVKSVGHGGLAIPAPLCPPEKRLPAGRAMIALTFRTSPLDTSFFITEFINLRPPYGDRRFHHSLSCGKTEILDKRARPLAALMAGIKSLRPDTISDAAAFAVTVKFFRRIGLHATQTLGFFGRRPVEFAHRGAKFFVAVSCCYIDAAGAAIQSAGCHQGLIFDFIFTPALHFPLLS